MDYTPNSHKYKQGLPTTPTPDKKKTEKVVKGTVKVRKKSEARKFADGFLAEDLHTVGTYLLKDVLIPTAKNMFVNAVKDSVEMLVFGSTGRAKSTSTRADYVSYRSFSDRDRRDESSVSRAKHYSYDDIVLEYREEAEIVLSRMDELIDTYGYASVADLYDLIGKTGAYTDNNYGWSNLRNAEAVRVRDGWLLKLPKALPIK